MALVSPFDLPGEWYRGNLHTHTTLSDGRRTPDEVTGWYRDHGYHFIALTDHHLLARSQVMANGGFLVLGGVEIDGMDTDRGLYHLVGLGGSGPVEPCGGRQVPAQDAIDRLRDTGAAILLAHPYWSNQMSGKLLGLEGCFGMEVYNGSCEVMSGRGLSAVHWDDLLAAGQRLAGVATDDAHWWPGYPDAGLGWIWLQAPALEPAAILEALQKGLFYSSSGPEIHALALAGDTVHVRCSPAAYVDFIGAGQFSQRVHAPAGSGLTEASCGVDPRQRYVRVVIHDGAGRTAWSNPLDLEHDMRGV